MERTIRPARCSITEAASQNTIPRTLTPIAAAFFYSAAPAGLRLGSIAGVASNWMRAL
jgi:hypothetical protein